MAMIGTRDKPTHFRIINAETKEVVATAPKSKVLALRAKLQKQLGKKLDIELIG